MKSLVPPACALFLLVGFTAAASAAPLPPMDPVTIEGTISQVQWTPDKKVKGRPGFSGSLDVDRTVPAHFRITLVDFSGLNKNLAWRINGIMSDPSSNPNADRRQPPPYIVLQLNENDPHGLKSGMRIRVCDYFVSGDEGGGLDALYEVGSPLPARQVRCARREFAQRLPS
jgi:hypothetical protein